jgi:WD40 repeat protein
MWTARPVCRRVTGAFALLLLSGPSAAGRDPDRTPTHEGLVDCLRPTQSRHREYITSLSFSPDGRTIASGSDSGVCLWESGSKEAPRRFHLPDESRLIGVKALRFVDGGKRLVTGSGGSGDATIHRWDTVTGKQLVSLGDWNGLTSHVALDREAQTIAVARYGFDILLLDARTGKARCRCTGHEQPIDVVVLSEDGKLLASSDRDGNLRLWDTATGKERPCLPGVGRASNPSLSPNGRLVAASLPEQRLCVWDIARRRVFFQVPVEDRFLFSAFSPDGRTIAVGGKGLIQLFEVATGKERLRLRAGKDTPWCLAWSPDGTRLAVGDSNATVWLYDVKSPRECGPTGQVPGQPHR